MHGVQSYDDSKQVMTFTCPACGMPHDYDTSATSLLKQHPTERALWSLCIGACPGCGSTHHLNCNLPDSHPHGPPISALLKRKHGQALPPSSLL